MAMNDGKVETNKIYAWIARDLDGIEGIIAYPTDMGVLPLISTDRDTAHRYEPAARHAARKRKSRAYLVEFLRGETIKVAQG